LIYVVIAIFIITYALLIFRRFRGRNLPIWLSMVVGAVLMVGTLSISPLTAFQSIDFRVISFLFGMIVITSGFEKSGLIEYFVLSILKRSQNIDRLLLGLIFGAGLLSAVLANDTIALLLTPLVIGIASQLRMKNARVLLIPLAFGITTGSVFTPIGNPQNLLVALNSKIVEPFSNFLLYLLVPSIVSMYVTYLLSKFFFRTEYRSTKSFEEIKASLSHPSNAITDRRLAKLSAAILGLLIVSFAVSEAFPILQSYGATIYNLTFVFGLALLVLTPRRLYIAATVNWGILIFFAGMFIVMAAVWNSGIGSIMLSALPSPETAYPAESIGSILLVSVALSQILSNVPFVQLYTFQMNALGFTSTHVVAWLALAAGSTLAGNLTLLGAVSNVIILDSAEARKTNAFSFVEFFKYGSIVTIVTVLIFYAYLVFV
jgi:Na+/H+ antiporter NhaD/arsenite permease-like protein